MAAPELRLNVSLDLGFFRQQLQKLSGIATSEFNAPLKVRFDRTTLSNEIRLLNRYVNNKTFNIKIKTNLEAEIDAADRLVQALQRVQQASGKTKSGLPLGIQGLSRTAGQGGVSAAEIKALFSAAIQGGLLDKKTLGNTRAQMVAALGAIGRDSIEGLLNGLESGDARLQKAAQSLGKSLITSFKDILGIASPSREFRKIGDDAGKGFEQGLLKAMEIAERSATRQMQRMLDRLARMALMMGGMSASEISRQIQATRALPSLNWTATSPGNVPPIGPSSSGRLLTGGPSMLGLPGTAFGSQKYLPTALGEELKKVLRDAANAFIDTVKQNIREVKVREVQNLLAPSRVAGLLSAGVGRVASPYSMGGESRAEMLARREREARVRSDLRAMDVMGGSGGRGAAPYSYAYRSARPLSAIVPYAAGGAMVPSGGGGGGGGTGGGPGNFARRGGGFGGGFNMPNLPGAGLVREIGQEFAFATKQVLLFGTAYKALAFLINFPAQVGQAVGQLQSFQNSLKAISPTAQEAASSNQFILDTVEKYNVPLQSARDGFIKLYASMQPAGFSGGEIRDLFLGISQAAASFGMSADKVDRVQYAFAQMASKGQVMSEELKGQLGDVLPGAMAIFAEAAGYEGPEAITKFSKALEDGAFKGDVMKKLLTNVGIVMRKEFGPGAEGAARTFQGVINRMQNSLKLLYESFEPAAVGFLNAVVMPMTSGIKTLADGFNAFFKGQAAQTIGGSAVAEQLNSLKPAFEGILANIKSLIPSFQLFGSLLLNVAKTLTTLVGNPIVGFLLKVYANVLLVNTAFTLLGGRVLLGAIASINAAIARMVALSVTMNALGVASTRAGASIAGTQLQMLLLQRSAAAAVGPVTALLGSLLRLAGIGTIAVVVTIAISGLMQLAEAEARIAKLRGEKNPVGPAGPRPIATAERRYTGATREKVQSDQRAQQEYVATLREQLSSLRATQTEVGEALAQTAVGNIGNILGGFTRENTAAKITELELKIKNAEEVLNLNPQRYQTQAARQRASVITTASAGDGAGGGAAKAKERESQIPQLTLALEKTKELSAIEMQIVNAQLMGNTSQLSSLELLKKLVEFKYEAKALALEDLTAEEGALKHREIALRREQAILESQLQLQIDLNKEREEIQEELAATIEGYQQEAKFQQMYLDLINQGILPSLAKARVETEKAFSQGEKRLDQSIEQAEVNIAALEVGIEALKLEQNLTPEKQEQLKADQKRLEILKEDLRLRGLLKGTAPERKAAAMESAERGLAPKTAQEYIGEGLEAAQENLKQLTNIGYQVVEAANAIGDAFGTAFKNMLSGSMSVRDALAGMFQSIADHFADMVAKMIANWMAAQVIQGFMNIFSGFTGGFNAGSIAPGPIARSAGVVARPGFYGPAFANGGIAVGGFKAFANGGMVTGPTMGLVGEGRYNEAIVPLPDGKSIPVDLGGATGNKNVNVVVNVDAKGSSVQGDDNTAKQLGGVISSAVQAEIIKQQRPGGLLASTRM